MLSVRGLMSAAAGVVAALVLAMPAAAAPLTLTASESETGWVALHVTGHPGTTVHVTESAATEEPVADIALSGEDADVSHATPWRCDRQVRRLVASATGPDGDTERAATEIRTPSCDSRLAVAI